MQQQTPSKIAGAGTKLIKIDAAAVSITITFS